MRNIAIIFVEYDNENVGKKMLLERLSLKTASISSFVVLLFNF
jgi:hypothetical protein